MITFICNKCSKEFNNKSKFTQHLKRKTSCEKIEQVQEQVQEQEQEKVQEPIKKKEIDCNKSKLGQFYTTNYNYILQSLNITVPNVENIIEPFAGNGDLIKFIKEQEKEKERYLIECYDIDPKQDFIIKRDTLLNPPNFENKYIITNPPYLARNKCKDKTMFDKYDTNDLYKCFLEIIIKDVCLGGIIIVPLNFISSMRKSDCELRQKFINKYNIINLNIFEENVFNDTKYSVCSFNFEKIESKTEKESKIESKIEYESVINCTIYPSKTKLSLKLNKNNNYTVGGEIYNLGIKNTKFKIDRATKLTKNTDCITNILLKCIDDSIQNKIKLSITDDDNKFIDTTKDLSARSYATLVIEPKIDIKKQEELAQKFNIYLNEQREKYNSLFLTNYRESNTIARKRISFQLAFQICKHLLVS